MSPCIYSGVSDKRTLWDQYKFKVVCPLYRDCPLLRDSNRIILIGGIKFGDLVLSIVERYLIQCPFLGGSFLRDSTVCTKKYVS